MEILLLNTPLQILILILSYIKIFKHFNFSKVEKVAIIAPNSMNWIALFIASILYGMDIVIISHRKNVFQIKDEILKASPNYIFTTNNLYNALINERGGDIRMFLATKRIFTTGNTENDPLYKVKIELLFSVYEDEYDEYEIINTKLMLDNQQASNREIGNVVDKILKLSKFKGFTPNFYSEVPSDQYLETFSDGSYGLIKHNAVNVEYFIKASKEIHDKMFRGNFLNTTLHKVHYDEYPILPIMQLIEGHYDRSISKEKTFFTKESFEKFWKEYIVSELENKWKYLLCTKIDFFYSRLITKVFKKHFPNTKEFIILDGVLPYKWIDLLLKSKVNFSITTVNKNNIISLYFKGSNNKNNSLLRVNPDKVNYNHLFIERITKGLPMVDECLVFEKHNKLRVNVVANDRLIDALGIIAPKDIYSHLMKEISKFIKLDKGELFVYDKTVFNDWFKRTHNGNIKRYLYS